MRFVLLICGAGFLGALVELSTQRKSAFDTDLISSGQLVFGALSTQKMTSFKSAPSNGFRSVPARRLSKPETLSKQDGIMQKIIAFVQR